MEAWIKDCERALCQSASQQGFEAYLAALSPTNCGGQCTAIWPAGALAYRCRTCQLTTSSAVCVACFKAGGHEDHDWIQYRSPSGGCCDCGDLSAWRVEGCCPDHQPDRKVVPLEQLLAPEPREHLEAVLEAALARLTECLGQCTGARCSSDQRRSALMLCEWLQRFACLAPLRCLMSDLLRRPLQQHPPPLADEIQRRPQPTPNQPAAQQSQRPALEEQRPGQQQQQQHQELERDAAAVLQEQLLVWQEQEALRQQLQQLQGRQQQLQDQPWTLVDLVRPAQEEGLRELQERIHLQMERLLRLREQQERHERGIQELQGALRAVWPGHAPLAAAAAAGAGGAASTTAASAAAVTAAHASNPGSVATGADANGTGGGAMEEAAEHVTAGTQGGEGAAAAAVAMAAAAKGSTPGTSASRAAGAAGLPSTGAALSAAEAYRAQAREIIARLPPPVVPPQQQQQERRAAAGPHSSQDCLLRRWTLGLRWLHPEPMHHLTSLLLLLLYDPVFKYDTAVHLMDCYAPMLSSIAGLAPPGQAAEARAGGGSSSRHPLCGVLDRVVVQLFNSEEVTVRLVQEKGVLDSHLSVLAYLTGAFVDELGKAASGREEGAATTASNTDSWESDVESEQRMNAILDAMRRLASDFSTLVHHAPAAHHLLSSQELWAEAFLGRFVRPLQCMLPHRRKVSGDVEERAAFRVPLACSAEFVVTACVTELLTTIAGMRPGAAARSSGGGGATVTTGSGSRSGSAGGADDGQRVRRVELLYGAARQALEACEEWCSDRLARGGAAAAATAMVTGQGAAAGAAGGTMTGGTTRRLSVAADLYDGLLAGELEASPHLPLHRTAAAFLQALLQLEQQGGPTGQLARARMEQLLSLQASLDEGSAWRPVSRFLLLTHAFISQIIARRWPRNGDDVSQVELFVLNGRELTDLDVLMTQCWMASEDPEVVLYDTLSAMGAKPLLAAAGVTAPEGLTHGSAGLSPAGAPAQPAAPAELQDPVAAAAASEALRWMVSLLRERKAAGLPPRERLRSILVQWLALRDWTYNQLHDLLPQDLQHQPDMEEVLAEVATYRAASLSQARQYTLRKEAWELFCPAFVHYTPGMRSRAWEAAMVAARPPSGASSGGGGIGGGAAYHAHWQLRRPGHALPSSLEPMQRVLETAGMWRLVAWVLQAFLSGAPQLPEDTLLGALNLLALQLHRLEDLMGRLPGRDPTATGAGCSPGGQVKQGAPQPQQHGSPASHLQPQPGTGASAPWGEPGQLRESVLSGAAALAGSPPPSMTGQSPYQPHRHRPEQRLNAGAVASPSPSPSPSPSQSSSSSSSAAARKAPGSARGAGILGLIEALLQSQTAPASGAALLLPAVHLSSEAVDCLKWLQQTAARLVRVAEEAGVLRAAAPVEVEKAGQGVAPEAAEGYSVEPTADGGAAEAEAARRRELARQRQAAMMARLRAQQEAFLRRATGKGGAAVDSSDEEEEEDEEDEKDEHRRQAGGVAGIQGRAAAGDENGGGDRADDEMAEAARRGGDGGDGGEDSSGDLALREESAEESGEESEGEMAGGIGSAREDSGLSEGGGAVGGGGLPGRGSAGTAAIGGRQSQVAAAPAATATTGGGAGRRQLPLGRWLAVDIRDPECAVCREGTAGGRHGPLAFIAHTAVCCCPGAPLRPAHAWDEDAEALGAISTVAIREAVAGRAPGPGDPRVGGGAAAAPSAVTDGEGADAGPAAARIWLRAWSAHGPGVSEADLGGGLHVHCCGHMIHTVCYSRFVAGQLRQYLAGAHFPGSHLVLPEMSEFLCPVCRRLSNCIVPAAPFQWRPPAPAPAPAHSTAAGATARAPGLAQLAANGSGAAAGGQLRSCGGGGAVSGAGTRPPRGSGSGWGGVPGPTSHPIEIADSGLPLARTSYGNGSGGDSEGSTGSATGPQRKGAPYSDPPAGAAATAAAPVLAAMPTTVGVRASPDATSAAGAQGTSATRHAMLASLPPLGHPAGLGALQRLMRSLEVCVRDPAAAAAAAAAAATGGGGSDGSRLQGRELAATGAGAGAGVAPVAGPGPGLGSRGCMFERTFGAYGEVVNIVTHQMTREGVNHMGQLERSLEARARLLQLRIAATTTMTTTTTTPPSHQAAQPSSPPLPPTSPGTAPPGPPSPNVQEDLAVRPPRGHVPAAGGESHSSTAPAVSSEGQLQAAASTGVTGSSSGARAGADAGPATAALTAVLLTPAAAGARQDPVRSSGSNEAVRSVDTLPGDTEMWVGRLGLLPPRESRLAVSSQRVADATAVWKGVPPHARIWAALAHNLAHFEALRRPVGLASGVLGAGSAAGESLGTSDAAAGGGDRVGGVSSSGTGTGGSVTGLPAVEAAHWRALQALASMAVCSGVRQVGSGGSGTGTAQCSGGLPPRDGLQGRSVPHRPHAHLQPLLAAFHNQLEWLLCELRTLQSPRHAQTASPLLPLQYPRVRQGQQPGEQEQPDDNNDDDLTSGEVASTSAGGGGARPQLSSPSPVLSPSPPLDLSYAFLPPFLPEVVIPRLAATLVGPSGPSLRSRGAQPHTSAYVAALSWRRLEELEDLAADPLLLALELLAVGLSGLSGASLPVPDPDPPAPGTAEGAGWGPASAAADTCAWLPGTPQQLFHAVLRLVWPIQVVQAALWRAAGESDVAPSPEAASSPACPPPSPKAMVPGDEPGTRRGPDLTRLVQLYRRALGELACEKQGAPPPPPPPPPPQQQQRDLSDKELPLPREAAAQRSSPESRLALGGLSAAVLPFLVRAYALDCTLGRQAPDEALMTAYSSLPVVAGPPSRPHTQHHQHQHHHKPKHYATTAAASGSTTHGSAAARGPSGTASPGAGAPVGPVFSAASSGGDGAFTAELDAGQGHGEVPAPGEGELAETAAAISEADAAAAAAAGAAALAGTIAAALGLSHVVDALVEPLLLSRRRATEALAAAAGLHHAAAQESPPVMSPSLCTDGTDVEEAILGRVLLRWCGPRVLALAPVAAQGRATAPAEEAGPAVPGPAMAAAHAAGVRAGAGSGAVLVASRPQRQRLPWYRGLLPPPSLIPLPHLFQSLFLHFAETRCPECGAKPENPALCLLTGRLVCNMWRGCAELRGGGLLHAREHCGGTCLLLSLRSTRVMALRGNRLAVCQSPYLDAHGDEDPDLRRGRPLYLDAACYRQLARLWGSAALEFDTQLLHNSRADLVGL